MRTAGAIRASMAADNTSGFNCRNAVAPGPPHWSAHAYGEAIDVNTVENPYVEGGVVQPAAGAAFLDRSDAPRRAWRSTAASLVDGVRVGRLAVGRAVVGSRLPTLLRHRRLTPTLAVR